MLADCRFYDILAQYPEFIKDRTLVLQFSVKHEEDF